MTRFDWQDISRAAQLIRDGALVGMPTETVYGLAADATNDQAVARIYATKNRPTFNPLIAHMASLDMAQQFAHLDASHHKIAFQLAEKFWPGPLTLVLDQRPDSPISALATAGLSTIAVRVPAHPIAHALIETVNRPIVAPSANPSGAISPTLADHVRQSLGERVSFTIDGGASAIGIESTIIRVVNEKAYLLRPGGLSRTTLEEAINQPLIARKGLTDEQDTNEAAIDAPGQLASHYAPKAALRLNIEMPSPDEVWLRFGPSQTDYHHPHELWLSHNADLTEATANLFAMMHLADQRCTEHQLKGICISPIPDTGLGEAINDRLSRAAA